MASDSNALSAFTFNREKSSKCIGTGLLASVQKLFLACDSSCLSCVGSGRPAMPSELSHIANSSIAGAMLIEWQRTAWGQLKVCVCACAEIARISATASPESKRGTKDAPSTQHQAGLVCAVTRPFGREIADRVFNLVLAFGSSSGQPRHGVCDRTTPSAM